MASQAMISLEMMRRVSEDAVRGAAADLTARQFALLLSIFMRPGPHAVRELAQVLELPKPAVSRALNVLERHGFVCRKKDTYDKRDVSIHRTVKGAVFLYDYGLSVALRAEETAACPDWIPALHPQEPISQPAI